MSDVVLPALVRECIEEAEASRRSVERARALVDKLEAELRAVGATLDDARSSLASCEAHLAHDRARLLEVTGRHFGAVD